MADAAAALARQLHLALLRERIVRRFADSYVLENERQALQAHAVMYRDEFRGGNPLRAEHLSVRVNRLLMWKAIVVTLGMIVARNVVEEFLGQLEGHGYLADRLELSLLDQLQATPIVEDGAWIYPQVKDGKATALVLLCRT